MRPSVHQRCRLGTAQPRHHDMRAWRKTCCMVLVNIKRGVCKQLLTLILKHTLDVRIEYIYFYELNIYFNTQLYLILYLNRYLNEMYCYYFHVSTVAICTCPTLSTHIKKKKLTKKENCLYSNQFSYISMTFKLTKLYIYKHLYIKKYIYIN